MHNNLLRRHEKEVELNVHHMETVTSLMVRYEQCRLYQQLAPQSLCTSGHFYPLSFILFFLLFPFSFLSLRYPFPTAVPLSSAASGSVEHCRLKLRSGA